MGFGDCFLAFLCAFCAFLWLILSAQDDLSTRIRNKLGAIINHLAAKKSLFYDAMQDLAGVRRQPVSVMNQRRRDLKLSIRIPNHDVGIAANTDRTLSLSQANLASRSSAEP